MSGAELTITFLGVGSAIPPNGLQQTCTALRHRQGLILFDCGEGSQYALRKYGISTRKEFVIWISHLHSDHFLGLPGLLASLELLGRDDPVVIVGPEGIKQTVQNLVIANYVNNSYEIYVNELQPGESYKGPGYTLETTKAQHEANALSVIFREDPFPGKVDIVKLKELGIQPGPDISKLQAGETVSKGDVTVKPKEVIGPDRKGRSVVYSGDTSYNEQLIDVIKNVDLLIHEGTYPSDMKVLAKERNHTTIDQAAKIAKLSEVKQLVITHISPRITDMDKEISNAKAIFENTELAKEGEIVQIPYPYHDNE